VRPVADPLLPALLWIVPNQPGTVAVLGREAGTVAAKFDLVTLGEPHRIELSADLDTIRSAGRQVVTVEVHVLDAAGHRIPDAALTVSFGVSGEGRLQGVASADLADPTPVTSSAVKLYQGRAVAVVRSGPQPGRITLRASSPGVQPAAVTIVVKE
jgi:beta-galactosidase